MNRIFALVAIVALLCFAVWAVWSPTDNPTDLSPQSESTQFTPEQEEIPNLNAEKAIAAPEQATAAVERSDFVPAQPVVDPSVTYGKSAEEGILVTVIDAESGKTLPKAEVMVIDLGLVDSSTLEMEMMRQPDFEALFLHFGVVYPTNDQAQVRVPFPEKEIVIAGRTTTHFDFVFNLELEDDTYELRIKEVDLLRIHVVDASGQAVATAPVGLRQRANGYSSSMMRNFTDANGWANLRLFPLLVESMNPEETFAALLGLFAEPIEEAVDLKNLPAAGVTLVMPKSGSLTVNLVNESGQPMKEYLAVSLQSVDPNQPQAIEAPEQRPDLSDTSSTGKVVFTAVGFGLDILVDARNVGGILSGNSITSGPTTSNPHVEIDVVLKMEAAVIKGRLVNEEGKPGPNLTLNSNLETAHAGGSSSTGSQIRTDKDGYFRLKLDQPNNGPGAKRTLTLTFKATRKKPERNVEIDLSRDFPSGETDIGDAMLTMPPVAVAGVILKPDGTPLYDAEVRLERRKSYGDGPDDFYWDNLWEANAKSSREGMFTISGRFEPGIYRLRINSSHYPSLIYDVRLGTEGHEIVLTAGGSLKGVLLLDENVPRDAVQLTLDHHPLNAPDPKERGMAFVSVKNNGDFVSHGLPFGTVDLIVRSTNGAEELFRIDGLPVSTDATTPHDVGVIDLRGKLVVFTVKFVDSKDKPVKRVEVWSKDNNHYDHLWQESLVVVTTQTSRSFRVSSEDYRTVELDNISEDTTVVMEDGIKVRVRISNPGLIPADFRAGLALRAAEGNTSHSHPMQRNAKILNHNFEQVLSAVNPGMFYVQVHLAQASTIKTNGGFWHAAPRTNSTRIEVLDVPGEQLFVITLDPDNIDKILEEFNQ